MNRTIDVMLETIKAHKDTMNSHKPEWDAKSPTCKHWLKTVGLLDRAEAYTGIEPRMAEMYLTEAERLMAEAGYVD